MRLLRWTPTLAESRVEDNVELKPQTENGSVLEAVREGRNEAKTCLAVYTFAIRKEPVMRMFTSLPADENQLLQE